MAVVPRQLLDFTGKVVQITGGRSGIGKATAIAFARQGASVVIAGRSHADETMDIIKSEGGEAIFVQADVSKAEDVQKMMQATLDKYGKLDVAFNNSGVGTPPQVLTEYTEELFDHILGVDLKGVFLCMKYQVPEMIKNGGGSIINCGSVVSLVADPWMAPYVAAKHGAAGLSKGAALDFAKQNVRVNVVAPGFTATEMTAPWIADPEFCEMVKSFNAANRWAESEEISGIVLFLASDMASFISGAVIPVDFGQTAH